MSANTAIETIRDRILVKEEKRVSEGWKVPHRTILVLELTDIPLSDLTKYLDKDCFPDLSDLGFKEVWLADYTLVEAHDEIELFGLFPDKYWGHKGYIYKKPFG